MRTVMESARVLTKEPENYEARAEVMWAGSLSHNGLTGCGAGGDWMTHKLEHELGGLYDVAHGAGLAAVWGSWARYVYRFCPERFARFAVHVLGLPAGADAEETALRGIGAMEDFALRGIGAMEDFYRELGMPPASGSWGWRPPRRSWPCWPASARRPAAGAAVPSAAWRRPIWPPSTAWRCENGGKQEGARLLKKPRPLRLLKHLYARDR